jgi:hypothetical protein
MLDEPATLSKRDSTKTNDQNAKTAAKPAASSALQGHVDYVDLTERVAQGVTVRMPDAEGEATPDTQPLCSTAGAISIEAPEESPPDTNEIDAKA